MNHHSKNRSTWLMLISGGMLATWLLCGTRPRKNTFPHLQKVQQKLIEKYGQVEAAFFVGKLQQRYEMLYLERPRFGNRKLQAHVNALIIPALALYQGLLEKTGDREHSVREVYGLMSQVVTGKSQMIVPLLGYFSDPFSILRRAARLINRTIFPAPGWDIEYIQDDPEALSFDIHNCLFLNILTGYGVPELTKVFCQFDDDIAELFPHQILWKRENTMAGGADLCDFRYVSAELNKEE